MERRNEQRIRRRLSCELFADGHRYQGIVVDLSASGLFLQTDAALDPGTRVDVLLKGSRFPEVIVRAVVARRRLTPTLLASIIHRGVGLRIVEAPEAYFEALREFDELKSNLERAVEVLVSASGLDGALDAERVEAPREAAGDAAEVTALYWFITRRADFQMIEFRSTPESWQRFERTVAAIVAGVRAGAFPAASGDEDEYYGGFGNCKYCDFDRICSRRRDYELAEKSEDLGLRAWFGVGETARGSG